MIFSTKCFIMLYVVISARHRKEHAVIRFHNFLASALADVQKHTKEQVHFLLISHTQYAKGSTLIFLLGMVWMLVHATRVVYRANATKTATVVAMAVGFVLLCGYMTVMSTMPQHLEFLSSKNTTPVINDAPSVSIPRLAHRALAIYRARNETQMRRSVTTPPRASESTPAPRVFEATPAPRAEPTTTDAFVNLSQEFAPLADAHNAPVQERDDIDDRLQWIFNQHAREPNEQAPNADSWAQEEWTQPTDAEVPENESRAFFASVRSEPSFELTDTTWAGNALPVATARHLVAQYDWDVEKALRVMFCESGRNPLIVNINHHTQDHSIGLFQINLYGYLRDIHPSEEWLKNPANNVDYAYRMYLDRGWAPWRICSARADELVSSR